MKKEIRNKMNECWSCKHKRNVSGNAHVECINPDAAMTGDEYGIRGGWFNYPSLFDPTWKTADCNNYEEKEQ